MRKQLDPRIHHLITNNVALNQRSFVVLIGDRAKEQIVNIHYLLTQAYQQAGKEGSGTKDKRPNALWCYKKDLGFTSHRKKREDKIRREVRRGQREVDERNPFEVFVTVTDIRYCYYKETDKVLGQTYGMCVLQDFEALTPNLVARTVETVQGGGVVVVVVGGMESLRGLWEVKMDMWRGYRKQGGEETKGRFNKRFVLSLAACKSCLFLDDELTVLPISRGRDIQPLAQSHSSTKISRALKDLQDEVKESTPAGPLVGLCRTEEQAKSVLGFIEALLDESVATVTTLTAARGRGKSAALGLALAGAVAVGYSNVYVTSPAPSNLREVFAFLFKGLDALGYEEHLDYDIFQAAPSSSIAHAGEGRDNANAEKSIVRVDVFRDRRQTIQYIHPRDAHLLASSNTELLLIDEAAAIPLPLVRELMFGSSKGKGTLAPKYLVFMSSTVHGYEGTGRALSLKLIKQLRESTAPSLSAPSTSSVKTSSEKSKGSSAKKGLRKLRELTLAEPIRYAEGDAVEAWLSTLLCFGSDSPSTTPSAAATTTISKPHPSQTSLYMLFRDSLFSFHPTAERFLQRCWSVMVGSHYKNTPNDLMLASDAGHMRLFVLLGPLASPEELPEPLAVLQVSHEGALPPGTQLDYAARGVKGEGDLVSWVVGGQYLEAGFGQMRGVRVVRVAVREGCGSMGYGTRAIECLRAFYAGEMLDLTSDLDAPASGGQDVDIEMDNDSPDGKTTLLTEKPPTAPTNTSKMPPLLRRLEEIRPDVDVGGGAVDWLGVSYGLSGALLRFWKRLGFAPLYVRQTSSDLTGEHTCVMLRTLSPSSGSSEGGGGGWLAEFSKDFRKRFMVLLGYRFREFGSVISLSVLEAVGNNALAGTSASELTATDLPHLLTPYDLRRLQAYGDNLLDWHVVLDLLPRLAEVYFEGRLGSTGDDAVKLSAVQSAVLLAVGLQRKDVDDVESELNLPASQTLALLSKIVRKITKRLVDVQKGAIEAALPVPSASAAEAEQRVVVVPPGGGGKMERELEEEGREVLEEDERRRRERQREVIGSLDMRKYAIADDENVDWSSAKEQVEKLKARGGAGATVVSVKGSGGAGTGVKRKVSAVEGENAGRTGGGGGGGEVKKTRRGGGGKKVKR